MTRRGEEGELEPILEMRGSCFPTTGLNPAAGPVESYGGVPKGSLEVTQVLVESETESGHGWRYGVRITHADGHVSEHTVTLAWVDHDHWSGGRLAPSRVVEAVVTSLLAHTADLPAAFDAARARRLVPEFDRELKSTL